MATTISKISLRPPRIDDAAAVAALLNACAIAEAGAPDSSPEEVLKNWREPGRDPSTDDVVAVIKGCIVGTIAAYPPGLDGVARIDGYVDPAYEGRGIGTQLLEWAEQRALRDLDTATVSHGVYVDTPAARLLAARGYRRARSFHTMAIDLERDPPPLSWPPGITVRTFPESGLSLEAVYNAVREAFDDHWHGLHEDFETFVHRISNGEPDPDRSLWFIAMDGTEIAGTIFLSERWTQDPDAGWIRYVGVRRPWRGRGLARALLQLAFVELARRGRERAALGVDSENLTGATRLYERAGMRVTQRIDAMQKDLRR